MAFRAITQEEKNQGYFLVEIPAGGAKSEPLNISSVIMYAIEHGPWTPSFLTFQVSLDGVEFADLYIQMRRANAYGDEFAQEPEEESFNFSSTPQVFRFDSRDWPSIRYLRFRSGKSGATVIQEDTRILKIGCK